VRDAAGKLVPVNLLPSAGGAEHLATAVAELRAKNPNHIFVAAGDLIGATPLLSAVFRDEPTIESLSLMGLEASAVGNHEFDKGAAELLRCSAAAATPPTAARARRPSRARSTSTWPPARWTSRPARRCCRPITSSPSRASRWPSSASRSRARPRSWCPPAWPGCASTTRPRPSTALVPQLQRQGMQAIVVLIHEGGVPTGDYNECPGISGPIVDIVKKLDKAVDVVISGHTHRAYNCRIDGRLVTSGDKYGTIVTEIDLVLDPATRDVTSARPPTTSCAPTSFAKDPRQTALIAAIRALSVAADAARGGPPGRRAAA
jgi:5'-nucleotidase